MSEPGKKSYGQILKASALIGGSSAFNVAFRMIRGKAMAVMLGPTGFGLMGLYWSISELAQTVAGLGINSSGVRQIAEAVGTGDNHRIARTVRTLRRVALILGAIGTLLLVILARPVSQFVFKDTSHVPMVALLSLAVFFGAVSAGQTALVQGMRRIADLARMNIVGAFYGTFLAIPIVYFLREDGVVPSLVVVAAMGIVTSWWYSRKIKVEPVNLTVREVAQETSELLKLGSVFLAAALMTTAMDFLIRVIVKRQLGDVAMGLYTAAWTFGALYVRFITQAMGADFYPRLTAVAKDNTECNRLVNEQVEVGLLLAGPGALAMLTFAPLVIQIFFSSKFGPAVEVFRWICMGMMLGIASWPLGFIILAKNCRQIYFWSELTNNLVYLGLIWTCIRAFNDLKGAGIGFIGMRVVYWSGMYFIARRLSGFRWSAANLRLAMILGPSILAVFASGFLAYRPIPVGIGAVFTVIIGIFSLKTLLTLVPLERFPALAQKIFLFFRLVPIAAATGQSHS